MRRTESHEVTPLAHHITRKPADKTECFSSLTNEHSAVGPSLLTPKGEEDGFRAVQALGWRTLPNPIRAGEMRCWLAR